MQNPYTGELQEISQELWQKLIDQQNGVDAEEV
jgi:hypothetical protein